MFCELGGGEQILVLYVYCGDEVVYAKHLEGSEDAHQDEVGRAGLLEG